MTMIEGVQIHGLPDKLVWALADASARGDNAEVRALTEVVDAHRRADDFAQRMFGNADPGPGEEPAEYAARIGRLWDEWMAAHPEWLGERARQLDSLWLERAMALARVRMGVAAADIALAHVGDADFMERAKAAQPVIHEATVAMVELQEQRRRLATAMRDPGVPRDPGVARDPGIARDPGVCRAERGPYACTLDEDHPPPHSAGRGVTWEDKVSLRRRIGNWLRRP